MRQVVQPMPRPSRPAPGTTGTQLPIRLGPAGMARSSESRHRRLAVCGQSGSLAEEVNPMAKLRQFVTWLVLVSGPTALLLIETAGNKAP
jgi:hypothetical protein